VKVSDVDTKGVARLIVDNAFRMRWRNVSSSLPDCMTPDMIYAIDFVIGTTSYILPTNHSLRISITSSNTPRFDINRNDGILLSQQQSMDPNITALNTIYHCISHPSRVRVPIVPLSALPRMNI
jgi:predicted acyl esterase